MMTWITFCREKFTLVSLNERLLIVGDGIKVSKESQCQPGLKFLHSPSQNQSKPQRFKGHHFGCTAFVAEKHDKFRPILQTAQIHEGVDDLHDPQSDDLYWGNKSFFLRFVWGIDEGRKFILMSSDLRLTSLEILKFYGLRFQIEFGFRVLRQLAINNLPLSCLSFCPSSALQK